MTSSATRVPARATSPAGEDGAGMVWAIDFHYQMDAPSSQKFVKAYQAEYGEHPLNYAAEAYDAAWFLAKSIKEAGSADRAASTRAWPSWPMRRSTGALGDGSDVEGPRPSRSPAPRSVERHRVEDLLYEATGTSPP